MDRLKALKISGMSLIFVGIVMILNGFSSITGFVIIENVGNVASSIFGLFLLIGGIMMLAETLEYKVDVYDQSHGKNKEKDRVYRITDPQLFFGNGKEGEGISLSQFKKEIERIRKDSDLIEIVREAYGPKLLDIYKSKEEDKSRIAESFLEVLYDEGYLEKLSKTKELTYEEKEEIKKAFGSGWKNSPNVTQARVLREYGLAFKAKPGHGKIYSEKYPDIAVSTSNTPGDQNAGRNIGKDVIRLIEERYKREIK